VTLEGRRVRLEPLEPRHEEALWAIAQDPRVWTLMRVRGHESREAFHDWFESIEAGFAHYLDGELVGHTSFLNDRPGDRVVEIGNTWLRPEAWGTGANTEAKYLLLRHAFEARATSASSSRRMRRTSAHGRLWPRCRPSSRASSASTCSCAAASGVTRRGTP
jgi:RimJ/RimL family protein N-acetyltransferase